MEDYFQPRFSFFPPLPDQRRAACMAVLRRERIKTVVELGCGEGGLLCTLTQPATSLDDFPLTDDEASQLIMTGNDTDDPTENQRRQRRLESFAETLTKVPEVPFYLREMHFTSISGVDLSSTCLEEAKDLLSPSSFEVGYQPSPRLVPLRLELWNGDLTALNEKFFGVDCMVMAEVVEHLLPDTLERATKTVFAAYRPAWVVITTPNYEFNEHIDQYSDEFDRQNHRFLDPTGRTDRYFRNDDHKFEWTREEFRAWCQSVSAQYDYDFVVSGCGSYQNYFDTPNPHDTYPLDPNKVVPPPESPSQFFATQTVVFRRRSKMASVVPKVNGCHPVSNPHRLVVRYDYSPHSATLEPINLPLILDHVKQRFRSRSPQDKMQLRDLWLCKPGLPELCHGKLIELIKALALEDDWEIGLENSRPTLSGMDAVWVKWLSLEGDFVQLEAETVSDESSYQPADDGYDNRNSLSPSPPLFSVLSSPIEAYESYW